MHLKPMHLIKQTDLYVITKQSTHWRTWERSVYGPFNAIRHKAVVVYQKRWSVFTYFEIPAHRVDSQYCASVAEITRFLFEAAHAGGMNPEELDELFPPRITPEHHAYLLAVRRRVQHVFGPLFKAYEQEDETPNAA